MWRIPNYKSPLGSPPIKKRAFYPGALTPFAAFIPLQAGPTEPLSCRFPCSIVHPLSPGIRDILKETDGREPDLLVMRNCILFTKVYVL